MFDYFVYYLIGINIITFLLYGLDKIQAINHHQRISENTLLNFSIFGGCFLGFIGMKLFHHKTKKKVFNLVNIVMIIIYSLLLYYIYKYI